MKPILLSQDEVTSLLVLLTASQGGQPMNLDAKLSIIDKLREGIRPQTANERRIVKEAITKFHRQGATHIDDEARVTGDDRNGAWVAAEIWVNFEGTPLDKTRGTAAAP